MFGFCSIFYGSWGATGVPQLSLLPLYWFHCLHICPESLHTFLGFPGSNWGSPQPQPRFHGARRLLHVPASPPKFQNASSCLPGRERSHQFIEDSRYFVIMLPHCVPHNILKRTQVYPYFTRNWGSKCEVTPTGHTAYLMVISRIDLRSCTVFPIILWLAVSLQ